MKCQHIGERSGLPCTRRQENHPAEHRYGPRFKPSRANDMNGGRRVTVPEGSLPVLGLQALARYREAGLELPGDGLATLIRDNLLDRL